MKTKIPEFDVLKEDDYRISDDFADKNKEEVLMFLARKGVAYPTEMSRELGLHIETINKILSHLKRWGFAQRIIPDKNYPQEVFKPRIKDYMAMGFRDYDAYLRCSFWTLDVGGIEYLRTFYDTSKKHFCVNVSLIKFLNPRKNDTFYDIRYKNGNENDEIEEIQVTYI